MSTTDNDSPLWSSSGYRPIAHHMNMSATDNEFSSLWSSGDRPIAHHAYMGRRQIPCYTNENGDIVLCFGGAIERANSVFSVSENMFRKFQDSVQGRVTAEIKIKTKIKTPAAPVLKLIDEKNKFRFIFKTEKEEIE